MLIQEWVLTTFPKGGFYVEAGAHDGVGDSTTKCLEDTKLWNGICVEPSSAFHGLQLSRKCHVDNRCLWSSSGDPILFREIQGNAIELSGILSCFGDHWDRETRKHKDVYKTTVSLTDLLSQYNAPSTIQFLSLDTEGSEYDILSTHDFDKYLFHSICVEHNGVVERRDKLQSLLNDKGYTVVTSAQVEDWFLHSSYPEQVG